MSSENSKISKIKLGDSIYDISANWDNISDKPDLSLYAPKVSPALTGVPTAPTASPGNNTTQIATTAFVKNEIDNVGLSGAMHFRGVDTSGNVYSGSTIGTYTVNNGSTTNATLGDVLLDDNEEFVWTGNNWELLGPNISFKIQQSAVSDPTASGTSTSFISSISQDTNGNITASKASLPAYPTKVSDLTNDSGFLTSHQDLSGYVQGNNKIYYGTCITGASIQNKVVTCSGYTLEEGSLIIIRMSNAQTYNTTSSSNISLNINNTGDINLKAYGTTQVPLYIWAAGEVIAVVYNGTNYLLLKGGLASTTYYGLTRLAASATSDNTTLALTPAALNSLVNGMVCNYPVYSKTTYAIGDRVRQNYSAWECNTTISTAEDWNASHWTELSPLQSQIDTKASLASPAVTGVPTARTASSGTNTTQIATTAFVNSAVDSAKSNTYTKAETEQLITHKESTSYKAQSINSQSQTGDNDKYPSVTAVRNYVNTKTDDLKDYIVNELDEAKVSKPSTSPNGTNGQLLRTKGDGTTEWVDVGLPTDAQTAEAVSDWLDDHPEATTTVEDGSVTLAKLHSGVIDSTLSTQGAAAEAKTTGNYINVLTDRETALDGIVSQEWEIGMRYPVNGVETWSGTTTSRMSTKPGTYIRFNKDDLIVMKKTVDYQFLVVYSTDNGSTWTSTLNRDLYYSILEDSIGWICIKKASGTFTEEEMQSVVNNYFFILRKGTGEIKKNALLAEALSIASGSFDRSEIIDSKYGFTYQNAKTTDTVVLSSDLLLPEFEASKGDIFAIKASISIDYPDMYSNIGVRIYERYNGNTIKTTDITDISDTIIYTVSKSNADSIHIRGLLLADEGDITTRHNEIFDYKISVVKKLPGEIEELLTEAGDIWEV